MKTAIIVALCLSMALCTLTIPLKVQSIYDRDQNDQQVLVDDILYAEAEYDHLSLVTKESKENVLFDLLSTDNYVISSSTKFGDVSVNPKAFDCSSTCDNGDKQTDSKYVLGRKATLSGGVLLKDEVEVEVEDSNDETKTNQRLYVPTKVDGSATTVKVLQFANAGLSLSRKSNNYVSILSRNNKLVASNTFSIYVHENISQLNIGGFQEYFIQPETTSKVIPTNNNSDWSVTIKGIKTKNGSQMQTDSSKVTAHFDLTSKYIYVPHVDGTQFIQAFYYFMNQKELECFSPNTDLNNKYSYICTFDKFGGFEKYNPITFVFAGVDGADVELVLEPKDYIEVMPNGNYELLFKFSTAPQDQSAFYFGTALFHKFYPVFNGDNGKITLHQKFEVATPKNGLHLLEEYRLPVAIVGSLIALFSVIILLVLLKRVKLDDQPNSIPMYSVYRPTSNIYSPSVNTSAYQQQPAVTTSVYNQTNVVVSSQALRQSQTQVRQSQQVVRNSQNYVVKNY